MSAPSPQPAANDDGSVRIENAGVLCVWYPAHRLVLWRYKVARLRDEHADAFHALRRLLREVDHYRFLNDTTLLRYAEPGFRRVAAEVLGPDRKRMVLAVYGMTAPIRVVARMFLRVTGIRGAVCRDLDEARRFLGVEDWDPPASIARPAV